MLGIFIHSTRYDLKSELVKTPFFDIAYTPACAPSLDKLQQASQEQPMNAILVLVMSFMLSIKSARKDGTISSSIDVTTQLLDFTDASMYHRP